MVGLACREGRSVVEDDLVPLALVHRLLKDLVVLPEGEDLLLDLGQVGLSGQLLIIAQDLHFSFSHTFPPHDGPNHFC